MTFSAVNLNIPLGSGPYQVSKVEPNRYVHYQRVDKYWANDLPVTQGFYNFDTITVDYFRDSVTQVEALKAGEYDYRWENGSKPWATAYNVPSVREGRLLKRTIKHSANSGIQVFAFNLRRAMFDDIHLRQAMSYAFDFEWSNKALFYNAYSRNNSYFTNSVYAADQLPDGRTRTAHALSRSTAPICFY